MIMVLLLVLDSFSSSLFTFFLVELLFSLVFLFWILFSFDWLFVVFLVGKVGLFPFWFWVFRVFDGFSLRVCLVIMTFFKCVVFVFFFVFYDGVFLGFFLVLNLLCSFLLFSSLSDLKICFCFFSLFSGGWLFFLSGREVFLVYFLVYFFLLWGVFFVCSFFDFLFGFFWVFFYLGFPFFFSFFVKVFGLLEQVSVSFLLSFLVFLVRVVIFRFCFFVFYYYVFGFGLLFLLSFSFSYFIF